MNTLTDVNNSVLAYRRSSFDILDTSQTQIQKQNALNTNIISSKVNIRIIFINTIIFLTLLCLIIFLKIPEKNSEASTKEINIDDNYERIIPYDGEYYHVPIVTTNDIHGIFFPEEEEFIYENKTLKYNIGGLGYISKYISILKEEYGSEGILYLDSGDFLFRPYYPKYFDGNLILDFFNIIGLNATTLGNHEFLWPRKYIENKINKLNSTLLINNIKEKNGEKKGIFGDVQKNSKIFEIKLKNNDTIKIGVIGLVLHLGPDKKFYDVGMKYTWDNITFEDYEQDLEKESLYLKNNGANAIIILAHIGLNCTEENLELKLYDINTPQKNCEMNSPLLKLLNSTKDKNLYDAIIAGDIHNQVHNWIYNIPIVSSNGRSRNFNIMYLPFKKINENYRLINDQIKIEGPLPLCQKIFSNKKNCEKILDNNDYIQKGNLVNYLWHNSSIELDKKMISLYDKYYDEYQNLKKNNSFIFTGFNISDNSLIENLFLDVIKNITEADISILHRIIFHKKISQEGYISYDNFIKLIPYSGELCTFNITGEELITIIKKVQKDPEFIHPFSGLKIFYKNNTIFDIKIYNKDYKEEKIEKKKLYKIASHDIIINKNSFEDFRENDILEIIREKINKNMVKYYHEEINQILYDFFKKKKIINAQKDANDKERIVYLK